MDKVAIANKPKSKNKYVKMRLDSNPTEPAKPSMPSIKFIAFVNDIKIKVVKMMLEI